MKRNKVKIIGIVIVWMSASGLPAIAMSGAFWEWAPNHLLLRVIEHKRDMDRVYDAYSILTDRRDPGAVVHALQDMKSTDSYLWVNATRYLGSLGREEAVPYLIKAMRHTASARGGELVDWLHDITGKNFGDDFEAWREWWLGENPGFELNWKSNLGHRPQLVGDFEAHEIAEDGKGSVAEFIVRLISDYGGRVEKPRDPPLLSEQWRYSLDSNTATIFIFGAKFDQVAHFLRDVLGEPDPHVGSFGFPSALAARQGFYSADDKNIDLSYRNRDGYILIYIFRLRQSGWH